jgi:hypothetical protein
MQGHVASGTVPRGGIERAVPCSSGVVLCRNAQLQMAAQVCSVPGQAVERGSASLPVISPCRSRGNGERVARCELCSHQLTVLTESEGPLAVGGTGREKSAVGAALVLSRRRSS